MVGRIRALTECLVRARLNPPSPMDPCAAKALAAWGLSVPEQDDVAVTQADQALVLEAAQLLVHPLP